MCSSLWFEDLQGLILFFSTYYRTGSPNKSKWCMRVPNTRNEAERTKIIIYVSLSSLHMSSRRKGDS